ncbi:MAG: glycosyltransferase [Candidatus Thiodiazotropha sp.]
MDILTFPPDYWDGPRHNRHYFCEELSKQHKVLFASPPFYLVDLLRKYGKGLLPNSGVNYVNENLMTYIPPKFLFTNYRFPNLNNKLRDMRVNRIKKLMHKHSMQKPILLMWHPVFNDMIDYFEDSLLVYYIYDNLSGYVGSDPSKEYEAEVELIKRADITFALSKELYDKNKKYSKNIHLLPNAVNYDLFKQSRDDATTVPSELADIPGPRIGYIGTINEKVDLNILECIAEERPEWSVVLIGRDNYQTEEKQRFEEFLKRKNVFRFGYKEYSTIPSYIKGLDALLMCYVINDWTFYGDPSKMHEYLASGKPTIATALPAMKEFEHVIDIPEAPEAWVDAIEKGLNEKDDEMKKIRIEVAQQNSYENRAKRATQIINDAILKKA